MIGSYSYRKKAIDKPFVRCDIIEAMKDTHMANGQTIGGQYEFTQHYLGSFTTW